MIYTLQYLTSQTRLATPYQLSSNLTSSPIYFMCEGLILKHKPLSMITNLMTFLTHCHDPSQPYEIIDEYVDYHYELSSSNINLINIMTQVHT